MHRAIFVVIINEMHKHNTRTSVHTIFIYLLDYKIDMIAHIVAIIIVVNILK